MARKQSPTAATVQREYDRLKIVAPHAAPLNRDDTFKTWYVGHIQIGITAREAAAYLRGAREALQQSGFLS